MKILLTGGAGYIGSHTAVELLEHGHEVVIVDNFCNSNPSTCDRIREITGKSFKSYEMDVRDCEAVAGIFAENDIDAVIHLAGLKAVGESTKTPIGYYRNNLDATLTLLECMQKAEAHKIIFSSSAMVYGEETLGARVETMSRGECSNPYGWTKAMSEKILEDAAKADKRLDVIILRYFNPIGAHESGLIGEAPVGSPNNLMPLVLDVASGRREKLTVFGDDYPTLDGTCQRDYIHVMDLAAGHLKAVEFMEAMEKNHVNSDSPEKDGFERPDNVEIFNLGTGRPNSVLEIIETFERVNGVKVNREIGKRRDGDVASLWADVSKAKELLGWRAERTLEDMCRDAWNWECKEFYI